MKTFSTLLKELNACQKAIDWSGDKNIEDIVAQCHRGDWLLWLAKKIEIPLKPLTLAKVMCAKTVIHLMKDQRSITALEVAEKFALTDEVTLDDLMVASNNAASAASDAASAASDAASAASAAVDAYAAAASDAASAASDAYAAYGAAASAAASAAARTKNQLQTADICRENLGNLIIKEVNRLIL